MGGWVGPLIGGRRGRVASQAKMGQELYELVTLDEGPAAPHQGPASGELLRVHLPDAEDQAGPGRPSPGWGRGEEAGRIRLAPSLESAQGAGEPAVVRDRMGHPRGGMC